MVSSGQLHLFRPPSPARSAPVLLLRLYAAPPFLHCATVETREHLRSPSSPFNPDPEPPPFSSLPPLSSDLCNSRAPSLLPSSPPFISVLIHLRPSLLRPRPEAFSPVIFLPLRSTPPPSSTSPETIASFSDRRSAQRSRSAIDKLSSSSVCNSSVLPLLRDSSGGSNRRHLLLLSDLLLPSLNQALSPSLSSPSLLQISFAFSTRSAVFFSSPLQIAGLRSSPSPIAVVSLLQEAPSSSASPSRPPETPQSRRKGQFRRQKLRETRRS